jgi:hypothetical protein
VSEYLWQCPFCNTEHALSEEDRQVSFSDLTRDNSDGPRRLVVKYAVCPDPKCRKFSLTASLHHYEMSGTRGYTGKHIRTWMLVPPSRAHTYSAPIPEHILQDYQEACSAIEYSPKAAAALSRRCLSSMLRDFWQVQPGRLIDEFRQIKGAADPLTWEAVESVKRTGSIGMRFESEGAEILDTDPHEAKLLIGLVESLMQDWYVMREERRKRLHQLRRMSETGEVASTDQKPSDS